MLGNCKVLKTDNGPPWNSEQFAKFPHYLGFEHRRITPYWPRANAEPERFMKIISKVLQTARIEGKNWKQEMYTFLRAYRNTPHCTTNKSPAELLFHRRPRTRLPQAETDNCRNSKVDEEIRERDATAKQNMKVYSDSRRHATTNIFNVGDKVMVKIPKQNKLSSHYDPAPYTITDIKGSMITAAKENRSITRNSSFFKKVNMPGDQPAKNRQSESDDDFEFITPPQQQAAERRPIQHHPPDIENQIQQPVKRRYPQRQDRHPPNRLNDFIT